MMQNQLKGTPIPIEPCQMNGKAQILFAMRDPQWGEFKDTKVTDKMGEQWRNLGRKPDSQSDYFVERFDQSPVYLLVWLSSVHLLVWLSDVHLLVWLSDVHLLVWLSDVHLLVWLSNVHLLVWLSDVHLLVWLSDVHLLVWLSNVHLLVWLSDVHLLVWLSDVHLLVWLSDVHLLVVVRSQAGRERDWRDCTCGNYGEDERIGPNSCLW
jgi:hypothetical protein